MVFVKKYGRSAITATFLLVGVSLPLYLAVKSLGIFEAKGEIEQFILAEFGAASLLIAAGALLGRIKCISTLSWGCVIPFYIFNELVVVGRTILNSWGTVGEQRGGSIRGFHGLSGPLFGISGRPFPVHKPKRPRKKTRHLKPDWLIFPD